MPGEHRILRFGSFEADLMTGEVFRNGQRIHLQHQPFQVLAALLERPGEIVSPEELRRRLWPEGTYVSFKRGLASAVRKVREALGDNARSPIYIETLQRRGYRMIVRVSEREPRTEPATPGTGPAIEPIARPPASHSYPKTRWAAAVIIAILIGGEGHFPAGSNDRLLAAESLSAYACVLKSRGERVEALRVIRQAQALAPESAKITAEVGFYLHAAGRYDEEFPMLGHAAELDPSSPDVWLHIGLAYARRSDFDRAIESLQRARRLSGGTDSRAAHWLTWAEEQRSHPRPSTAG
jgi:DNA-binding winged helix-turn-helix (wHTH) protein